MVVNQVKKYLVKSLLRSSGFGQGKGQPRSKSGNSKITKQVIDELIERHKDRGRKEIDGWRNAIMMAEHPETPRRDFLINIIDDLRTDGHLQAVIQIRKSTTLNTEFNVKSKKTGEIDLDKTEALQSEWFYGLVENLLDTPLYGHTLIQATEFLEDKVTCQLIPREHVVPNKKWIIPDLGKDQHYSYDDPSLINSIIEMGNPKDLGLLNILVPDLIWKRNALQAWAEFTDRFGNPFITATTHQQDDKHMDYIIDKLLELGDSAVGVFPKGTDLNIHEANRTDAYQTFDKKIERHDKTISKTIIGGTMITDNGSSRSQSEVHEKTLDHKISKAERRNISFVINNQVIPMLIRFGWKGFTEDDQFVFDTTESLGLKEHWNIAKHILDTHEVDDDYTTWVSKTFNVPAFTKKSVALPTPPSSGGANNGRAKSISAMANISSSLVAQGIRIPNYQDGHSHPVNHEVNAAFDDEMQSLTDELLRALYDEKDTLATEAKIIATESIRLLSGLFKGWSGRTDIAYNEPDHLALAMMEYNVFEFCFTKNEARLAAVSELLINKEEYRIKSFADFKRSAYKITDRFNINYLRTEYNKTVAVGASSSNYLRMIAEKDAVPYWQYQTVGDENVRREHADLDGLIFSLEDKAASRLIAPNGHNCRCENIQYPYDVDPKKITDGKEAIGMLGDEFAKSEFNVNYADTKQVFTKKQFYTDGNDIKKKANDITYETMGLPALKDLKGFKKLSLDETITAKNVNELFRIDGQQSGNKFMGFEDYLKRKIILKKGVFDKQVKGVNTSEKERRHQLFPHINQVLQKPDEVWLHQYKDNQFQSRYVKHFEGQTMVIDADLQDNNLEIKQWHLLHADEDKIRKGLLISNRLKSWNSYI